ncbi:hypothetical protein HB777_36370 (plasmid) [Mesorhizobium loti]|nr:hypothetical protein HB777_35705 [Mesorhizobium loti]QND69233.1 hypothetical protein HB777_36370 [Mesorhizobium loti]
MIDLWDIGTYDSEIKDYLESHRDIIDGYSALERKKDIMVAKLATWVPIQPNRFQGDYAATVDGLAEIMSTKTLRTFHYTRMTDDEVESVQAEGMVPTSVDSLTDVFDKGRSALMSWKCALRAFCPGRRSRPRRAQQSQGWPAGQRAVCTTWP